ncbi:LytR/AlgR family response regulator transcription factor [Snuella lapsa]|uniref:LytTR family DNA-binding domain-containing protein n=1 Tax=Snuella lapsa TaxID=870481 RepID=A0ABP6Y254_9FLAO
MTKNKISAIIADDEPLARKRIANLIEEIDDLVLIKECASGEEAIKAITQFQPHLVFLDIQMTDMTGFDVLKNLDPKIKKPQVIFISAFDEFALKAFEFFAFDYLLKPFKDERFFRSVNKIKELYGTNKTSNIDSKLDQLIHYIENPKGDFSGISHNKLPIKTNNKVTFVKKEDIKYILASGYYAEIYTDKKKYLLRDSLSALMHQFEDYNFIRIHRSTIINIDFIQEVLYSSHGEIDIKMNDSKLFRVSKSHKKEFQNKVGL